MHFPIVALIFFITASLVAQDKNETRVVLDFENGADVEAVKQFAMNTEVDVVQDNGVTRGKNCCRLIGKAGQDWANFQLRGEYVKGWDKYEYVALDVFTERSEKIPFSLELLDRDSKNYQTRCTFEDTQLHSGRNTLLWRIDRAKRNKAEGREWHELTPAEKIRRDALTSVRFIFSPPKEGGDTVLWIDNLRLLGEDAAVPKMKLELPAGVLAYDFGPKGTLVAGFQSIAAASAGLTGTKVVEAGKGWPDPLTGDGLESSAAFTFDVPAPDGEYCVWISAGKVLNEATRRNPFTLKVGDQTLCDEKLSDAEFYSEKGIFRHLRTQFSQRPHALWLDYVLPVAPEQVVKAKAAGGKLSVQVSNHRLAALIAMPADKEAEFKALAAAIREQRIRLFENGRYSDPHEAPKPAAGDGAYALWIPAPTHTIRPWSAPSEEERKTASLDWKGAPGQRVTARICVTAFQDLGEGDITLSALTGPATIPAQKIRTYYQNYRVADTSVDELALLPWTKIRFEAGTTWSYMLWLEIPEDAAAGQYRGTLTFKPASGGARELPIQLEVYPFKLLDTLPLSLGMYYSPWKFPEGFDRRKLLVEQHRFMREVGFTGTTVGTGNVESLNKDGTVNLKVDPLLFDIAKEVGLGRHPKQQSMGSTLSMARTIARKLGLSPQVDQQPGIEFQKKELKPLYQDAVKKFAAYIQQSGVPVAFESVDEPREHPNPWNRNLEHTNTYADWIKEACSIPVFVTPMGDGNSGKDYISLVDHHDILSIHAWQASKRILARTREAQKTLWFYNTGMDRLSWGFYAWRMGAVGRWEWHWASDGLTPIDGYPCELDGYTPFTGCADQTLHAPYATFPGGFTFKSSFLSASEGITDYAYILTLEAALAAAKGDAAKAKASGEAQAFLDALRKSIPEFPSIKNMSAPDAGALVGAGLDTPVAALTPAWRARIAEFLKQLK
ncbi:MAG TPA: hypothetical protein VEK08_13180 [Planctomycetota bacterium]|nr:hypothetical protein [Planctomycetota bacterium]